MPERIDAERRTCPLCGMKATGKVGVFDKAVKCPRCGERSVFLPTVTYAEAIKALLGGFASNGRLMVAARIGAYILAAFVFMACAVWYARPDGSTIRIPTVADLGNAMSRHDDVELSEFLLLDNGISYREACSIIGFDGTEISRVAIPGMGAMVMYSWANKNGSNMNAQFHNDKLTGKAQCLLK
jgi:ribosomal protein S27AE